MEGACALDDGMRFKLRDIQVRWTYAKGDEAYLRIRFEGNGSDVAFWDQDSRSGSAVIGQDLHDLDGIRPLWPAWSVRLHELRAGLAEPAAASA